MRARRRDQRQVADQTRIDQAVMRRNPRPRLQLREQDRRRAAGDAAQGSRRQGLHRFGAASGDLGNLGPVLPQEDRAPGGVVQHARLRVLGTVGAILDIGGEQGRFGQDGVQFRLDRRPRSLDPGQPIHRIARLELDLRQTGKHVELGLLVIETPLAGHQVQRSREPCAGRNRVEAPRLQPVAKALLESSRPLGLCAGGAFKLHLKIS
ncbi:hypothetical protein D3C85_1238330 [compost metagenome]